MGSNPILSVCNAALPSLHYCGVIRRRFLTVRQISGENTVLVSSAHETPNYSFGSIAQSVERLAVNQAVAGSSPVASVLAHWPSGKAQEFDSCISLVRIQHGLFAFVAQLAEQLICNQQVIGSNPIGSSWKIFHHRGMAQQVACRGHSPEVGGSSPSPAIHGYNTILSIRWLGDPLMYKNFFFTSIWKFHISRAVITCTCAALLAGCQTMLLSGCAQTGTEGFDVRLDTKSDDAANSVTVSKLDQTEEDMKNTSKVTSSVVYMNGDFELPLDGAMGISVSPLEMHDENGTVMGSMKAGCEFTILAESENDLRVRLSDDKTGIAFQGDNAPDTVYIDKDFVLINLPDVIPSIVYDNTNSYSSLLSSKGYAIANLTGEALYQTKYHNDRFDNDQYVVPVLYETAKKLKSVQEQMLKDGNSLKIYESYRPFATQQRIIDALTEAMKTNPEINKTITQKPWGKSWFIALHRSNHQRGCAVDTTMVKVTETEEKKAGSYTYTTVSKYEEYPMPTQIHDMSADSIARATATLCC